MAVKLHRPLVDAAAQAVVSIFNDQRHADKTIEYYLRRERRWGARDRRFFAETVYDVTRWWRRLNWCVGREFMAPLNVEDALRIIGVHLGLKTEEPLPPWLHWSAEDVNRSKQRWSDPDMPEAVRHSLPDWLEQKGREEMGEEWPVVIEALNGTAPVFLRINALKVSVAEARAALAAEKIVAEPVPGLPEALQLAERRNVFVTQLFHAGGFEVQDGGSQQIAPLLGAQPGERVIDACAGAGGKTLHLAALMKNRGKIIALDVHAKKLDELRLRSRRAGADIVEVRLIESTKTIKRLRASADRLLLDVPCSGSGVWRRNPDARWKLSADELARLIEIQSKILQDYSAMLKPGGTMVYATCSLWPSENEGQVKRFLGNEAGKEYRLEQELHVSPARTEFDGFYAAKLIRI